MVKKLTFANIYALGRKCKAINSIFFCKIKIYYLTKNKNTYHYSVSVALFSLQRNPYNATIGFTGA